MSVSRSFNGPRRRRERGIVMWVALVVLIVMALTGLAMLRQTGGGISIAGNIAFKEGATSSADAGIEAGRLWWRTQMAANIASFDDDMAPQGYYATWGNLVDPVQIFAELNSVPVAMDRASNTSAYIIQRLCQNRGPIEEATQVCSEIEDDTGRSRAGLHHSPNQPALTQLRPYYRITSRVRGPRDTVSYTQVIIE